MKQIIQYQKSGEMFIEEVPLPKVREGWVLVKNIFSLISAGTERTSVETAQASMIGKAKSRPDLVKQVMENAKREGLKATYDKVMNRLDSYKELGYSCAGIIIESGTDEFKTGDRVACGGATANHSEVICVPKNLTVKLPENVDFDEAAFTTLGAIAMQGVRQADLRVGENAAVIGLGLLGLLTVQILKAGGIKVIGLDINDNNFNLAKKFGCDETAIIDSYSVKIVESFTNGYGTDSVIITAGTKSNEPIEYSLKYARKKSNIVIVGAVGMNMPRSPFYEKELNLRISCSYGPGRYDSNYEEKGIDYPYGYIRWTERRNMQSVLDLISSGKVKIKEMVTHAFGIEEGLKAYDVITGKSSEKYLGILIKYGNTVSSDSRKISLKEYSGNAKGNIVVGFIGAGNFAQSYLIPNLDKDIRLKGVVTSASVSSKSVGKKFGFEFCSTDAGEIIGNTDINTIFIATRHESHGKYVIDSLKNNKNVYVEKPLCIDENTLSEIKEIITSSEQLNTVLAVGFNRRFSKPFIDIKDFFKDVKEPLLVTYRVNAGYIPKSHWIQDGVQKGRIIGEGCHFIDTITYLTGGKPIEVFAAAINSKNSELINNDNVSITIKYENGSVGNIIYLANGDSSLPKEYCEVFGGSKTAVMNNFKLVEFYQNGKTSSKKYNGGKGHKEELDDFINVVRGNKKPEFDFESMYLTTLATFRIIDSLQSGNKKSVYLNEKIDGK